MLYGFYANRQLTTSLDQPSRKYLLKIYNHGVEESNRRDAKGYLLAAVVLQAI